MLDSVRNRTEAMSAEAKANLQATLEASLRMQHEATAITSTLDAIAVKLGETAAHDLAESQLLPLPKCAAAAAKAAAAGSVGEPSSSAATTPIAAAAAHDDDIPQQDAAATAAVAANAEEELPEGEMNAAKAAAEAEELSEGNRAAIAAGILSPPPGLEKAEDEKSRSVSRTVSHPRHEESHTAEDLFRNLAKTPGTESEEEHDEEPAVAAGHAAAPPLPEPINASHASSMPDTERSGDIVNISSSDVVNVSFSDLSDLDVRTVWRNICIEFDKQKLDGQLRDITATQFLLAKLDELGCVGQIASMELDAKDFVARVGQPKHPRARTRDSADAYYKDTARHLFNLELKTLKDDMHEIREKAGKVYPPPKQGSKQSGTQAESAAEASAATAPDAAAPAAASSTTAAATVAASAPAAAPSTAAVSSTPEAAAAPAGTKRKINVPVTDGMKIMKFEKKRSSELRTPAEKALRRQYWEEVRTVLQGGYYTTVPRPTKHGR
jgi:hypothetical protein